MIIFIYLSTMFKDEKIQLLYYKMQNLLLKRGQFVVISVKERSTNLNIIICCDNNIKIVVFIVIKRYKLICDLNVQCDVVINFFCIRKIVLRSLC